jgi:uncharacterized protein YndB with AHSA1/START domain
MKTKRSSPGKKPAGPAAKDEIVITRVFDAPRTLVFKAWTDAKQVQQWWGPRGFTNPVCDWVPKPGRAIHVVMRGPNGVDYPMGGAFREIVEPERLVFTSSALDEKGKPMFELLHDVDFAETKGKTTLTIRTVVLSTTDQAPQYLSGYRAGMTQSLERLAEQLAVNGEPLIVERTFNAPAAKVWHAITTAEAMSQWYFKLSQFKPVVGFEFQFAVEHEGTKFLHFCQVKEVKTEKKLSYSWRYDGFEGDSLVTFELFAEGSKTRVRLTHEGLDSFPKLPSFARANFTAGWTALIGDCLKQFVEANPAKK